MADIFISYAREDRSRAEPLAKALEEQGWTVWWDPQIPPGKTFYEVIKEALDEAKCVVVLWSNRSISSEWVLEEASIGKRRKILVPARIDKIEPPLGFGLIHAADLMDWQAEESHAGFVSLLGAISDIVGSPPPIDEKVHAAELLKSEIQSEQRENLQETPTQHEATVTAKSKSSEPASPVTGNSGRILKRGLLAGLALALITVVGWYVYVPKKAITNSIGMKFLLIPTGSFMMGSSISPEEVASKYGGSSTAWYESEHPQHSVEITNPFYMQATEVTQGQWKKVMGDNPSDFKDCGEECPIERVSWDDANKFISKLNEMEDTSRYRLPTESEWEYAYRAGTTTIFTFGDDASELGEYAWYWDNSEKRTHPVASKRPNSWGLYDMHGNVHEWVEDDWHYYYDGAPIDGSAWIKKPRSGYRVKRGGSWSTTALVCRSASRYNAARAVLGSEYRSNSIGFRVARSVTIDD
jgi:formylglycine-generating enzyme required for sulfatase activity